ncbi:hypothetical protein HUA74_32780 [Myxococcus sp. CA051A]|uniref:hypothetical protein n=1 Tax=unclassified Myxococcus TaxID=2648731 RepID=UPI00157B31EB|nr:MULTISPECIES: hypothetical protein [unclassified Myxococcus]NTX53214.1 hypothetical protein [Myxococcus sp. CA039A]NTX65445.1 hypothetical protein [Myxococcus sp. CA051A]
MMILTFEKRVKTSWSGWVGAESRDTLLRSSRTDLLSSAGKLSGFGRAVVAARMQTSEGVLQSG